MLQDLGSLAVQSTFSFSDLKFSESLLAFSFSDLEYSSTTLSRQQFHRMASASQHASSSASSYEVFLSFRGEDVRHGFADHLYHALDKAGIRTFRDDEELNKGEEIAPNLLAAIQQSRISIPILSMNYASSKWCLNELKEVSECKKIRNQTVLPVFYKIEPTNVRNQTGEYAKAFDEEHPQHFDQETVKKWRDALKEIGKLDGWHLKEAMYEGKLVKEIVKIVSSTLNKRLAHVFDPNLVGMESHIERMLELLDIKSEDTKIVGIHGFGGIGKTTIARVVCNTILNEFDEYAFIENVREDARKYRIPYLQNKFITGILKDGSPKIIDVDTGIKVIRERLCKKKILVVLDDVDEDIQAESLVGDGEWFGIGSKIIITSRDKDILISRKAMIYEPHAMNLDDSLELFCRYAFKANRPQVDYLDLSKAMVKIARGLPLALKVIGSSLFSKKKPIWESILKKLQKVPNNDVIKSLKISYDELEDTEQQMFLDTTCFFIGMKKDFVCCIWDGCDFYPEAGLDVLCAKSLITIDEYDEIAMHDVLQDLGRDIVRRESTKPGERSRIWSKDEVLDVLLKKQGTNKCVGLTIDFKYKLESRCLMGEGLDAMTEIRLLQLDHAQIAGNCNNSFSELRWLSWKGCFEPYVLTNFRPEKLVVLDLSYSEFTETWMGWNHIKMAANLRVLNLECCFQLCSTPDLSGNQLLEVLILRECDKLIGIDTSIGYLKKLVKLDLEHCKSLIDLPIEICELGASLETLKLSGCRSLRKVSDKLKQMISLTTLSLSCDDFVDCLHSSLSSLKLSSCNSSLTSLSVRSCSSIQYISGLPSSLKHLQAFNCKSMVKISSASSGNLQNLEKLHLVDCTSLEEIGDIDENLGSLVECRISSCKSLKILPKLRCSKNLSILEISRIGVSFDFLGEGMDLLKWLEIRECNSLEKIPYLRDSRRLRKVHIENCHNLIEIKHLGDYESLEQLHIRDAPSLKTLSEDISALKNLRDLNIKSCESMESLPDLSNLKRLRELTIWNCKKLFEIGGLYGLDALQELDIDECENLAEIHLVYGSKEPLRSLDKLTPDISNLKKLRNLLIVGCDKLSKICGLDSLESLQDLGLYCCKNLAEIHGLDRLKSLKSLNLYDCCSLEKLPDLSNLKELSSIGIVSCHILSEIAGLDGLESLQKLSITGCRNLTEIHCVERLKSLKTLRIEECNSLETSLDLSNFKNLERISIKGCKNISDHERPER